MSSTCVPVAGTHGDFLTTHTEAFLNVHTGVFSLLFSFLSPLFLPLSFTFLNTVQNTDQQKWRSTSKHVNVIWRRATAKQSVLSPPLLSLPPTPTKKKRGLFIIKIFRAKNLFFISVSNCSHDIFQFENMRPGVKSVIILQ